jgi:glycosyltransferase involved in cell wall biosynthesis
VYGTPAHPTHPYLWDCFFSVLAQRCQRWHHAIVDDASTDESAAYIESYQRRADVSHRCTVTRLKQNGGPAAAFNVAVRSLPPDVDWLVCVDADDMIDARYLSEAAAVIAATPSLNAVYAHCRHFGTLHQVHRFKPYDPSQWMQFCQIPGQAIYRRSLWDQLGGYDETMWSAEDWDFYIRAEMAVGLKPFLIDAPRWCYRSHDGPRMSMFALSKDGQNELREYWAGHRKDTLGTRTWGRWRQARQMEAVAA